MSRLTPIYTIYGLLHTTFGLSGRHTGLAWSTGAQAPFVFKLRVLFRGPPLQRKQASILRFKPQTNLVILYITIDL
jgi:hypothetical protein